MATKKIQIFSTLEELLQMIQHISSDMNLQVFLYCVSARRELMQIANITTSEIENYKVTRLYLTANNFSVGQIDPNNIAVAKFGLVQVDLPFISNQTLFMADISAKTDWFDDVAGLKVENKKLTATFKKIKSFIVKQTAIPVIAENIVTKISREYPDIRYTKSAKTFYEAGGQLMQMGVNNIRFRI